MPADKATPLEATAATAAVVAVAIAAGNSTNIDGESKTPACPMTAATARADPPPQAPPAIAKRTRRGFGTRKRIELTIEADDESHGRESPGNDAEVAAAQDNWWKLEYRAPPPGHLGAHAVPVVSSLVGATMVTIGASTGASPPATAAAVAATHSETRRRVVRRNSLEVTERKMEMMEVTPSDATTTTTQRSVHETPERAQRRPRGGELYASEVNHSSPSQKRKIIDLQEYDSTIVASMVVAKELKRFHESSNGAEHVKLFPDRALSSSAQRETTPSTRLLRCPPLPILGTDKAPNAGVGAGAGAHAGAVFHHGPSHSKTAPESA